MDYLCSECSTQLSKFEVELNTKYPIGKLYCEFCQSKKEREIINKKAVALGWTDSQYVRYQSIYRYDNN